LNDLFLTSATVVVSDSSGEVYESTFLKLDGSVNIGDAQAILIPFDSLLETDQEVTIVTKSGDPILVEFNYVDGKVTVDGVIYEIGDSFVLDGKRILVSG